MRLAKQGGWRSADEFLSALTPAEFDEWVMLEDIEQDQATLQTYLLAQLCWLMTIAHLDCGDNKPSIKKSLKLAATMARHARGVAPGSEPQRKRKRKANPTKPAGLPAAEVEWMLAHGIIKRDKPKEVTPDGSSDRQVCSPAPG